jgi:hypothetical protein
MTLIASLHTPNSQGCIITILYARKNRAEVMDVQLGDEIMKKKALL